MKKRLLALLCLLLMAAALTLPVAAAESEPQVTLIPGKDSYSPTEAVSFTLTVTNTLDVPLQELTAQLPVPTGYILKEGYTAEKTVSHLAAGETVSLGVTYLPNPEASPPTGDGEGIFLWAAIFLCAAVVFTGAVVLLCRDKKLCRRMLCLLLCLALLSATPAMAASPTKTCSVTAETKVGFQTLTLTATVTYTPSAISEDADTDGDGIDDIMEQFHNTDPLLADTDGDGLSDYTEVRQTATDPTVTDSDGNGIADGNEDADGDGLSNLEELTLGTALDKIDTDSDELSDGAEVHTYKTAPLLYDTDADGVYDGYELRLGTDPLTVQDTFHVTQSANAQDSSVSAAVDVTLSAKQVESLTVKPVGDALLLPETMPGYLGCAYDFSVEGEFEQADISFTFDPETLSQYADPAIFYFNEETQSLEELDTVIENGVATATVEHFSTYILLDRTIHYGSFTWEDTWDSTGTYSTVKVVFVIDDSGSMGPYGDNNDPEYRRLSVAQEMIDTLPAGCKIGVTRFATTSQLLTTELTEDREAAKSFLTKEYFTSKGSSTNMYLGINDALTLFQSTAPDALKTCIVLTDGRAHDHDALHDATIAAAQEANVVLYTVGLGEKSATIVEYLRPLAEETGGQYYLADNARELTAIYDKISQMIDLSADTDGDTIPDYYEDNAVSFSGVEIALDKTKSDTDGDGVPDNEEVSIELVYSPDRTRVYIKGILLSAPDLQDTDFDGITDDTDAAPNDHSFTGTQKTDYATSKIGFQMDYSRFAGDNRVYNEELSKLSVLLAGNIYDGSTLSLSDSTGTYTIENASLPQVLSYLGMKDTRTLSLNTLYNDSHLSEVGLGYHNVVVDGVLKTVVAVVVRGTNGTLAEWSSNCDIGDISKDAADDDWINTLNHKGFDITANRISLLAEAYIQENELDPNSLVYWVTGHSRGAAIANIIGANLEKAGKTAFTYTFAAPNCTLAEDATSYQTIFNVINNDDFVPYLPMAYWGYTRYGQSTTSLSIKDSYEKAWERFTGIGDYNPDSVGMEDCIRDIGYIMREGTDPRVEGYTYTCACHGDGSLDTITITNGGISEDSREKAIAKIPACARECCIITRYDGGWIGGWDFDCCQLPTYLMQVLAAFLGGEINAYRFQIELNIAKRYEKAKGALVSAALGGITHPHYPETYYVLADDIHADAFG